MNATLYLVTDRSQHFNDGNETADDVRRLAGNSDDTVGGLRTAHGKHFDLDAELLAHVSELGAGLADDAASLALMYQKSQL